MLPLASETIEVLWVLEDDSHYWWRSLVLDIYDAEKGSILATATLQYESGPINHESAVQRVKFRKDNTDFCVKRLRGDHPDQNTWRYPVDEPNCENDGDGYEKTTRKKPSE